MSEIRDARLNADALRLKAEAQSGQELPGSQPLAAIGADRLLHELRVHQIELEMQNEELRRALVEVDAARDRYFDLYELAPVGYLTMNAKGLILEANLTAATLLGEPRGALVHQPFSRFILPEDLGTYFHHRTRLLGNHERQAFDLQMLTKSGSVSWLRLETTQAKDASGAQLIRATLSNVSKHKQVERLLQDKAASLETALRKLELLAALLPLCEQCKRLRDEKGEWRDLEESIARRSATGYQHERCPLCRTGAK